jgi:hypothetical protein
MSFYYEADREIRPREIWVGEKPRWLDKDKDGNWISTDPNIKIITETFEEAYERNEKETKSK